MDIKLDMKNKELIIFPLLILFSSCGNKNEIPEEKFIQVYVDLVIAQDTTGATRDGMDSLKKDIFTKHRITEDQYIATVHYYNEDPDRWKDFFDKATMYAESLKKQKGKGN